MADTSIPGKNEVTVKWKEISKDKRNGFISNYTIFYKPEDGKELSKYTLNSSSFNRVMTVCCLKIVIFIVITTLSYCML